MANVSKNQSSNHSTCSVLLTFLMCDMCICITYSMSNIFHLGWIKYLSIYLSILSCRIERLWRDVWMGVTSVFYHTFHMLEEEGLLDLGNATHFFCLHYVFLPRLQANLNLFRDGWDNHPLRTEQNLTPNQLWEVGQMHHPVCNPQVFYIYFSICASG